MVWSGRSQNVFRLASTVLLLIATTAIEARAQDPPTTVPQSTTVLAPSALMSYNDKSRMATALPDPGIPSTANPPAVMLVRGAVLSFLYQINVGYLANPGPRGGINPSTFNDPLGLLLQEAVSTEFDEQLAYHHDRVLKLAYAHFVLGDPTYFTRINYRIQDADKFLRSDFNILTSVFYAGTVGNTSNNTWAVDQTTTYSNFPLGIDISFDSSIVGPKSVSEGFRYDVSPGRAAFIRAIARAVSRRRCIPELKKLDLSIPNNLETVYLRHILYANDRIKAAKEAVKVANSLHVGLSAEHAEADGGGTLYASGISASRIVPLGRNNGLIILGSMQQYQLRPSGQHSVSAAVPALALVWQNKLARLESKKIDKMNFPLTDPLSQRIYEIFNLPTEMKSAAEPIIPGNQLTRWDWQAGIEYNSMSGFSHVNDVYGAFVRYRWRPFWESKVTYGIGLGAEHFMLFELGHTFAGAHSN